MGTLNEEVDAEKKRWEVIDWLNGLFADFKLAIDASEEELRAQLLDGAVLCSVLSRINPDLKESLSGSCDSFELELNYVERFLLGMEEMGLPCFRMDDLQQGSMSSVVECLLALREHLNSDLVENDSLDVFNNSNQLRKRWKLLDDEGVNTNLVEGKQDHLIFGEKKACFSENQHKLISPITSGFRPRQGLGFDILEAKTPGSIMASGKLDNAPTKSLLGIINGILTESIDNKNGELTQRVAFLLRRIINEVERRISTQAEHIKNQNNIIKSREEKYQSRIKVLETLTNGTNEEIKIVMKQLQLIKAEKLKVEQSKRQEEQHVIKLTHEKERMETIISELKQELTMKNEMYEQRCQDLESRLQETTAQLNNKIKEVEFLLIDSHKKIKEFEEAAESKLKSWKRKENIFQNFIDKKQLSVQNLGKFTISIRNEVMDCKRIWNNELINLGAELKVLVDAAENYHTVLTENQRLFNEVQELKGNIRVYCRIRPFLSNENEKSTTIDYIGENGELLIANPFKQGKDASRVFKFNKVFGPSTSQASVFADIQPLIRSVLDGYNVCIFAYGQTGSGKTYTMSGPNSTLMEDWGVNYRALHDLFNISQSRRNVYSYEVGVQMVEIYNEQVRDLLSDDGLQKRLGIWSTTQPNGLAVPEASMHPVLSTSDVLQLMQIGQANRAVGSTALNERSSRSHSILTVHVRGVDLKNGSTLRGCLHLIDLAGSERVDRSEATGDRLKEAQHINKSLSALGDVIFALSQKSSHVPYRNSKLTQVLQSSLGGQAKTLMFVQINPDVDSYLETISTLKFAERVSGVELGAARSNKDSGDVKDLLEQVAWLKDTIARKDEEIEQLLKDPRAPSPISNNMRNGNKLLRHSSSSPGIPSLDGSTKLVQQFAIEKVASNPENFSEFNEKHYGVNGHGGFQRLQPGHENQGFGNADMHDRMSDISDSGFLFERETTGSIEFDLFPESNKATKEKMLKLPSEVAKVLPAKIEQASSAKLKRDSLKFPSARKPTSSQGPTSSLKSLKSWK